jgi:hypothetical protein
MSQSEAKVPLQLMTCTVDMPKCGKVSHDVTTLSCHEHTPTLPTHSLPPLRPWMGKVNLFSPCSGPPSTYTPTQAGIASTYTAARTHGSYTSSTVTPTSAPHRMGVVCSPMSTEDKIGRYVSMPPSMVGIRDPTSIRIVLGCQL